MLTESEGMQLLLPAGSAELVAVAPVQEAAGVSFTPVALTGMFNGGGAVVGCTLRQQPVASGTSNGSGRGPSFDVQVGAMILLALALCLLQPLVAPLS